MCEQTWSCNPTILNVHQLRMPGLRHYEAWGTEALFLQMLLAFGSQSFAEIHYQSLSSYFQFLFLTRGSLRPNEMWASEHSRRILQVSSRADHHHATLFTAIHQRDTCLNHMRQNYRKVRRCRISFFDTIYCDPQTRHVFNSYATELQEGEAMSNIIMRYYLLPHTNATHV